MELKRILIISLLAFVFIFILQNHEIVKLQFVFWSFSASRAMVVIFSLLIGFLSGLILYSAKKKHK